MSVAWTTILVIALLFPGVFFFIGLSTNKRSSGEVVRSNAIGDVGLAILLSLFLHILAYWILSLFGFNLAKFIETLPTVEKWLDPAPAINIAVRVGIYTIVMAIFGWTLGFATAKCSFLERHKWISTVNQSMKDGLVTAYVMTTTVQNGRALMYKGVLSEFFLTTDGTLTYVVLKSCSRFLMKMDGEHPTTTAQMKLFGANQDKREWWDYLFIDAKNIANVLFDPSPEIKANEQGMEALERALSTLNDAIRASSSASSGVKPK